MALKNISPRIILAIVSFPGFAFQVFLFGMGVYVEVYKRSNTSVSGYLLEPLFLAFVFDFVFFGMPLIPFLVMIGVAISFVRRKQGLNRWTPATATALALTISSYALFAYISNTFTLP